MLYLVSQHSSTPNPILIRNPLREQTIPPGVEIPESWRDPYAEAHGILPGWAPVYLDDTDIEERLNKDIEELSCDELERHLQTEDFGRPDGLEAAEHI